jgi:hypothetical protein
MLYVIQKKTLSSVIVPLREDARRILIDKYHTRLPQVSKMVSNLVCLISKMFSKFIKSEKCFQSFSAIKPQSQYDFPIAPSLNFVG